jgi:iron(III) transport system substrate-binding protein
MLQLYSSRLLGLLVGALLALAACASRQSPPPAQRVAQYDPAFEKVVADGRQEGQVVVAFFSPPTPTVQKKISLFENSYGIRVNVVTLSAAQFFARLEAERAAGKLSMDLRVSGYPDGRQLSRLRLDQPFGHLPEAEAEAVPWLELFHPLREARAGRNMIIYRGHGWGMVINRQLVPLEQAPKTWKDLANPIYKGRIILFDPSISGPGCSLYHFLTDVYGAPWANEFLRNVAALTRSPFQADKQAARGEFGIHVPSSSGTLVSLWSLPEPRPFYTVVPEDGALMIASTVSLLKDAPHPNAARAFTNFLLSKEAQQIEADEPGGGFIRLDVKPRVPELAFHLNAKPFPGTPEKFEWADDMKHTCESTVAALNAAGIKTGQ